MYILVIVGFLAGIMFLFLRRVKGISGEEAFDVYLEELTKIGSVFQDVFLENQSIAKYVLISSKGIVNIYYNPEILGKIYGDEDESTWKQVMEHRKLPVPNPVRLMEKQRRVFEDMTRDLDMDVPVHELLCLSKRVVPKLRIDTEICRLESLKDCIDGKEDVLTGEEVARLTKVFQEMIASAE